MSEQPAKIDGVSVAEFALRMVTLGRSFSDLQKEMRDQGIPDDLIAGAIDAALAYYRTLAEFTPEEELGKACARLNLLFMSSMEIQDYKTALSVQKEINRLLDLKGDPPVKDTKGRSEKAKPTAGRVIESTIDEILNQ
jgi:hypothetical protein